MMEAYQTLLSTRDISMLTSTKCFQCFSHTVTMNVFQYLGLRGTVLATSAACASGLQAVGVGYDLVRLGRQDLVLCGGAEELHETVTGSFDILAATSTGYNRLPEATPRPFDRQRDGLVCGEGAGVVVLEDRERALARGAPLHGEILGYHTCGSSFHVSQSDHSAIAACILGALRDADVPAGQVDYISAHATGTIQGDAAEARAIREIFGARPPVSSLKGHLGHTLAASGAIELVAALRMMAHGIVYPTRNLEQVGPDCDGIGHVQRARPLQIRCFLKNCFAFGGINAALVCGQA
jgi:3-oxoacyl-[acyl-carrier-protein] synthase II